MGWAQVFELWPRVPFAKECRFVGCVFEVVSDRRCAAVDPSVPPDAGRLSFGVLGVGVIDEGVAFTAHSVLAREVLPSAWGADGCSTVVLFEQLPFAGKAVDVGGEGFGAEASKIIVFEVVANEEQVIHGLQGGELWELE